MVTTQYFYRNAIISKRNQQVFLIDIDEPTKATEPLDPWFGMIMMLADGHHTIDELVDLLATKYQGGAPPNLKETIHSAMERMVQSKLIMLTEKPTDLPYYLKLPYEQLDIQKAKKIMMEDNVQLN